MNKRAMIVCGLWISGMACETDTIEHNSKGSELNEMENAQTESAEAERTGCERICETVAETCSGDTAECVADCEDDRGGSSCDPAFDALVECCTQADYTDICADDDVDIKRCYAACEEAATAAEECGAADGPCETLCGQIAQECSGSAIDCISDCREEEADAEETGCEEPWQDVLDCCENVDYAAACVDSDLDIKRCLNSCESEYTDLQGCEGTLFP